MRSTEKLLTARLYGSTGPVLRSAGPVAVRSGGVQRGDTVQQMLDNPFYHPVIEEGLRTALRQLSSDLHLPPPPPERCLDCDTSAEAGA